jgi:gas vesicle protein
MSMNTPGHREYGFVAGLFTGTFVGASLMMWLVPRMASEVRQRATDSARRVGQRAAEQYQQASTQAGEAIGEIARRARGVRDDVAEAVARGAHEVERYAAAVKSDSVPEGTKPL